LPLLLVAGVGCRQGCSAEHLAALLERTLARYAEPEARIVGLASLDRKVDEPGLRALAKRLGCALQGFSAEELNRQAAHLTHRSERVLALTGCYAIAESAALALAERHGCCTPRLSIPRQTSPWATLALAQVPC
jgi:cobalt-precorrin 5A hydrolase